MRKKVNLLLMFIAMFFCACLNVSAADVGVGWCEYSGDDNSTISIVIDDETLETGFAATIYDGKYSDGVEIQNIYTKAFRTNFKYYDDSFECSKKVYKFNFNDNLSFYDYLPSVISENETGYVTYTLVNQWDYEVIKGGKCVYTNCEKRTYQAGSYSDYSVDEKVSGKIELEIDKNGKYTGYYDGKKIVVESAFNSQFDSEAIFYNGSVSCPKHAIFETWNFNRVWFGDDESLLVDESHSSTGRKKNDSVYCTFSSDETTLDNREELIENREENPDVIYDGEGNIIHNSNSGLNIDAGKEFESCDDLFGNGKTISLLRDAFRAITIVTPILIIVLSVLDFVKAVGASDEKAIKEAQSKFIKRLIIAVLIFFLPTILNILFNLLGNSFGICGVA